MRSKSIKEKGLKYLGSLFFLLLALLSKEAVIILPCLMMLVIFLDPIRRWQWKPYLMTSGHWLVAGGYFILRQTLLNFSNTFHFYEKSNIYTENMHYRSMTFLATLPDYLKVLVWPVNLHMERSFPVFTRLFTTPVVLGIIIIAIGLFGCWQNRNQKNSTAITGFLWFLLVFIPMSGILIPVNSFFLEHWLYFSSLGLFIGFAYFGHSLTTKWSSLKKPITVAAAFIAVSLTALTLIRNRDWRDPITFYSNILKYTPGTARVHNNIAMGYAEIENWPMAEKHYYHAIKISDTYPQSHYNLARIFIRKENYKLARRHLHRSLEINPNFHFAENLIERLDQFRARRQKDSQ